MGVALILVACRWALAVDFGFEFGFCLVFGVFLSSNFIMS